MVRDLRNKGHVHRVSFNVPNPELDCSVARNRKCIPRSP